MLAEKKMLTLEELESQTALELPDRTMLALVNVTLVDVASGNQIGAVLQVPIGVAANVCNVNAAVLALAAQSADGASCTAEVDQDTAADLRQRFQGRGNR